MPSDVERAEKRKAGDMGAMADLDPGPIESTSPLNDASTAHVQPGNWLIPMMLLTQLVADQNKKIDELTRVVASEPAAKRPRWQKQVSSNDLMVVQLEVIKLKQQVESLKKRLDASEAKEATAAVGPAMPPKPAAVGPARPKQKRDWQLMTFTEKIQDTARWIVEIRKLVKDDELFRILFSLKQTGFDMFLNFAATEGTVQEEKMEPETKKQLLSKIQHLRGCFKLFLTNQDDMMKEIEDCRQKKLNPEEFHAKMKEKMSTLVSDAYKSQSGQGCMPGAGGMVGPAATTNTQK